MSGIMAAIRYGAFRKLEKNLPKNNKLDKKSFISVPVSHCLFNSVFLTGRQRVLSPPQLLTIRCCHTG